MTTPGDILDHTPLNRGKYRGQTPSQISEHDPGYVVWLYENWDKPPCSKALYRTCQEEVEANRFGDDEDDSGLEDTYDRFNGDL